MNQCRYALALSVVSAVLVMGSATVQSAIASDCILYTTIDGSSKRICDGEAQILLQQMNPSEEVLAQNDEERDRVGESTKTGVYAGATGGSFGGTFGSLIRGLVGRNQ